METALKNAYFAGLIDGEGCVNIYPDRSQRRPVIKVAMTCERTIDALHAYFGGYKGVKKIEDKPNRKPQWLWQVTHNRAIDVCEKIRPYLITKASGADLLLAHGKHPRGRPKKNGPGKGAASHPARGDRDGLRAS